MDFKVESTFSVLLKSFELLIKQMAAGKKKLINHHEKYAQSFTSSLKTKDFNDERKEILKENKLK